MLLLYAHIFINTTRLRIRHRLLFTYTFVNQLSSVPLHTFGPYRTWQIVPQGALDILAHL